MFRLQSLVPALLCILLQTGVTRAEEVTPTRQGEILNAVISLLDANYIFPERVKDIETAFRSRRSSGLYSAPMSLVGFLEQLNADIQTATRDKHIRIGNNPRIVDKIRKEAAGSMESSPEYLEMIRSENFRLKKLETLDGNIGYFKFDNFIELQYTKDALSGAMHFLRNTSAIILDLTDNGGGAGETVGFFLSYFLPESTVIGSSWTRKTNATTLSIVTRERTYGKYLPLPCTSSSAERPPPQPKRLRTHSNSSSVP
jgi:hypothetical protein